MAKLVAVAALGLALMASQAVARVRGVEGTAAALGVGATRTDRPRPRLLTRPLRPGTAPGS